MTTVPAPRVLLVTRVLLVSSADDERERYAESFRRGGFCTLQACSASDGFRLAAELPPAAIVTDVSLSGEESGLELARRLKHDQRTRRVPVVVLTANVITNDRETAARAGCDLFVWKPCLPDALSQVVVGLIQRQS